MTSGDQWDAYHLIHDLSPVVHVAVVAHEEPRILLAEAAKGRVALAHRTVAQARAAQATYRFPHALRPHIARKSLTHALTQPVSRRRGREKERLDYERQLSLRLAERFQKAIARRLQAVSDAGGRVAA